MQAALPGAPWLIAHRSMLGINKPYSVTLNDRDYVLWQNGQGQISALENVCPHRQAPLSAGWICPERNTITCPFHALEFNDRGQLYRPDCDRWSTQPLARPLDLTVRDDFIWTYGNCSPQQSIPDLPNRLTQDMTFIGVASNQQIQADLLRTLQINYDFNHVHVVHGDLLNLSLGSVSECDRNGHTLRLKQHVVRKPATWLDKLRQPAMAFTPQQYTNQFEYHFPAIISLTTDLPLGRSVALNLVYPEAENRTRLIVLLYAQVGLKPLIPLIRASALPLYDQVLQQDAAMLEQLYPRETPKIRLQHDELLTVVEQLYNHWPQA